MERRATFSRKAALVLASAMATAFVSGCTGSAHVASAGQAAHGGAQTGARNVADAEKRVAKSPRDADARVALAQAYLNDGRFESAVQTFDDARQLGDSESKIALGSALAYIGAGHQQAALKVLAGAAKVIPVSDYGLALALAGRPDEAVEILTDAVRAGQGTPRMRQNLAYAYALQGNWGAAKVIASQDVAPDQLDARLAQWSQESAPQDYRIRVAGLLGAPMVSDPGQPAALALNPPSPDAPRMASAAAVPVAKPGKELPAIDAAPAQAAPAGVALASVDARPTAPMPVAMVPSSPEPVSPVAMPAPSVAPAHLRAAVFHKSDAAADAHVASHAVTGQHAHAPRLAAAESMRSAFVAAQDTHLVQLGSFRTLDGAKRSWATFVARNPRLKSHAMRITQADVNGRRFYRVSAEGFDAGSARSMCGRVRERGAGCFAYAKGNPLPGALGGQTPVRSASAPAHTEFAVNDRTGR